MDWSHELVASLTWLAESFVISMICLTIGIVLVARFTVWGRQFQRLTWAYFAPWNDKRPLLWLSLIVLLTLFGVRMNVLFSFWYNGFYSALQKLDLAAFWSMLAVFSVLATIHVIRTLIGFYLRQALLIRWRLWLTDTLMDRWLANQVYYRSRYASENADNPDQRIQQDIASFAASSLTLLMGLLDAVVSLFAFSIILWGLSGALAIAGIDIPHGMVFVVYVYVFIATVLAIWLGRPLIRLSFLTEKFNANFRYALIRLREYSESIAFFKGEAVERNGLGQRFMRVIGNSWDILYRTLKFSGFNLVISQASVVFPFIVQAPRLFSKQITLGDMMQTSQAFGQVEGALSFFRSSYDDFAAYRAVLIRLNGFLDLMEGTEALPSAQIGYQKQAFGVQTLDVSVPSGALLLRDLNFQLLPGSALLVRGRSGVGKTTLLRAIAGLWPFVTGKVMRPEGDTALFLPQEPYLPLGTLRAALYYPAAARDGGEAAQILRDCLLDKLIPRLDDEEDWSRILSPGEQQRLAIGRVLLAKPQMVFMDEASSAMDESLEHTMYTLVRARLPDVIMISVGHRSSLLAFHTDELELQGEGKWALTPIGPMAPLVSIA
ncbi:MAG: transporter family protein 67 [Herbaspirillum sp.]|jgi:putative ATP-binding cassette transporter|nr:transporter family protein 67 [Herbaspirillum sp.]